jgi:hypothetical protein
MMVYSFFGCLPNGLLGLRIFFSFFFGLSG